MKARTGMKAKIEFEAWAEPAPGITLEQLVEKLEKLNHKIITIDRENNRIKVLQEVING